ncbi:rhomboid-like protein [Streptomyces sp. NPDC058391]|uniref:rhomboid-like protein n=1 Tax=Streptomyces sp. NPDC058391 TaxID=3346476 RepID=UPI00365DF95C
MNRLAIRRIEDGARLDGVRLDGVRPAGFPRQRTAVVRVRTAPPEEAVSSRTPQARTPSARAGAALFGDVPPLRWRIGVPLALIPGPRGTPFTFGYALVLLATSFFTAYGDPATVSALLRGSSTDVAHLVHHPVLVLLASALWIAGGPASPYAVGLVLVLTALERRIGGPRTAGVFLLGHVGATLATEIPIGLAVLAGQLPTTSLHRLDYGISFGLMASVGALAGLLAPMVRWPLLGAVALMLAQELLAYRDPITDWGHPTALAIGVACWPAVRRVRRAAASPR